MNKNVEYENITDSILEDFSKLLIQHNHHSRDSCISSNPNFASFISPSEAPEEQINLSKDDIKYTRIPVYHPEPIRIDLSKIDKETYEHIIKEAQEDATKYIEAKIYLESLCNHMDNTKITNDDKYFNPFDK